MSDTDTATTGFCRQHDFDPARHAPIRTVDLQHDAGFTCFCRSPGDDPGHSHVQPVYTAGFGLQLCLQPRPFRRLLAIGEITANSREGGASIQIVFSSFFAVFFLRRCFQDGQAPIAEIVKPAAHTCKRFAIGSVTTACSLLTGSLRTGTAQNTQMPGFGGMCNLEMLRNLARGGFLACHRQQDVPAYGVFQHNSLCDRS